MSSNRQICVVLNIVITRGTSLILESNDRIADQTRSIADRRNTDIERGTGICVIKWHRTAERASTNFVAEDRGWRPAMSQHQQFVGGRLNCCRRSVESLGIIDIRTQVVFFVVIENYIEILPLIDVEIEPRRVDVAVRILRLIEPQPCSVQLIAYVCRISRGRE